VFSPPPPPPLDPILTKINSVHTFTAYSFRHNLMLSLEVSPLTFYAGFITNIVYISHTAMVKHIKLRTVEVGWVGTISY
jgi:hypothetical protein